MFHLLQRKSTSDKAVRRRQTIRKPKAVQLLLGQGSETQTVLQYGKAS